MAIFISCVIVAPVGDAFLHVRDYLVHCDKCPHDWDKHYEIDMHGESIFGNPAQLHVFAS